MSICISFINLRFRWLLFCLVLAAAPFAAHARFTVEEKDRVQTIKKAIPLSVNILITWHPSNEGSPSELNRNRTISLGAGFIWDRRGHIVTNHHVIDFEGLGGSIDVWAVSSDGRECKTDIIGSEPRFDLAVLQCDTFSGNKQAFSNRLTLPKHLHLGQTVFAIGSPLGYETTITTGVVSGIERYLPGDVMRYIQTDTTIQPGNSGGPLLDSRGYLVGMNTFISVAPNEDGGTLGAGFGMALPSDMIAKTTSEIIQYGRSQTPTLGVGSITERHFRLLSSNDNLPEGAVVGSVAPGSPADEAGLQGVTGWLSVRLGEVIVGINNQPIRYFDDLAYEISRLSIGDQIVLQVLRDGTIFDVNVTL